jgi:hypothetical protein
MKTSLHRQDEIRTLANKVFGDEVRALRWLCASHADTRNRLPFVLIQEREGAALVERALKQKQLDRNMRAIFGRPSPFRVF